MQRDLNNETKEVSDNALLLSRPSVPLFLFSSEDSLFRIPPEKDLFKKRCAAPFQVTFYTPTYIKMRTEEIP